MLIAHINIATTYLSQYFIVKTQWDFIFDSITASEWGTSSKVQNTTT